MKSENRVEMKIHNEKKIFLNTLPDCTVKHLPAKKRKNNK